MIKRKLPTLPVSNHETQADSSISANRHRSATSPDDMRRYNALVRHWPITVEKYDSGQIGFVARPIYQGKRFNRSFSTSKFASIEEAVEAAIAFCKQALTGKDEEIDQAVTLRAHKKIARHGISKRLLAKIVNAEQVGMDVEKLIDEAMSKFLSENAGKLIEMAAKGLIDLKGLK